MDVTVIGIRANGLHMHRKLPVCSKIQIIRNAWNVIQENLYVFTLCLCL